MAYARLNDQPVATAIKAVKKPCKREWGRNGRNTMAGSARGEPQNGDGELFHMSPGVGIELHREAASASTRCQVFPGLIPGMSANTPQPRYSRV